MWPAAMPATSSRLSRTPRWPALDSIRAVPYTLLSSAGELDQPRVDICFLWRARWHELGSKPLCIHDVVMGMGNVRCNQGF